MEALGRLHRFTLTAGEVHDVTQAPVLISDITADAFIADKAFDSDSLITDIRARGARVIIPPRSNRITVRRFDRKRYRRRNIVERFFCRLKHFRRIATRYEKLAQRFSSFIAITAAVIWLR